LKRVHSGRTDWPSSPLIQSKLSALAGFALMSGVVSTVGLRIANPVPQEIASVSPE
jgi:hypothetical protein